MSEAEIKLEDMETVNGKTACSLAGCALALKDAIEFLRQPPSAGAQEAGRVMAELALQKANEAYRHLKEELDESDD